MYLLKTTACNRCSAEFEIQALEEHPILFCPGCGEELEEEEPEENSDE